MYLMAIFFRIVCSILIGHNDILKISDFGTSKEFHEHERSMTMSFAGTYAWMPPEVIKNEPCSEKVDIWWVCTMYELNLT